MENNLITTQILFRETKKIFLEKLNDSSPEEINNIIYWGMENIFHLTKVQILSDIVIEITKKWEIFIDKILNHYPIQYFLEEVYFYRHTFFVNENVLIPRPETELIIEKIIEKYPPHHTQNQTLSIIDLGTGSGCLAVSLALLYPKSTIFAVDISEKALEVAKKNAQIHQVKNIYFECLDMQKPQNLGHKWDIIISNPPYICEKEKLDMSKNVLEYEPHLALFVPDNNALIFYKAVADWAKLYSVNKGSIFVEINQNLAKETLDIFAEKYF